LPKSSKSSAGKKRSSALHKLLSVGTDVKRLYSEPEFRDLVASALLLAAKALREDGDGGKPRAKPAASSRRSSVKSKAAKAKPAKSGTKKAKKKQR